MDNLASMPEADTGDFGKRFPGGKFGEGIINLFSYHKIDSWRGLQGLFRLHRHRRSNESNLQFRFDSLHHLGQPHIILPADRAGVQGNEIILTGDRDGLLGRYTVRGCIQQTTLWYHASRVGEPNWIPKRSDFTRCWPTRAGPTIKLREGGGIQ